MSPTPSFQQPRYNRVDMVKPVAVAFGVGLTVGAIVALVVAIRTGRPDHTVKV